MDLMGTSNWQNIPFCINAIRRIQPQRILDVGIGFGRWGILCREFLEVWNGKTHIANWELQIDGVEIFESNIEEYHKFFYSNIYNENISDFLIRIDNVYDLIILGDVMEHFEEKNELDLLNLCLKRSEYVILNLPLGRDWQQGEVYHNPYERHLSFWEKKNIKGKNCIHYKIFRDYIGRKFGSFLLSEIHSKISFVKRTIIKLKFIMDNYPYPKSIVNERFNRK